MIIIIRLRVDGRQAFGTIIIIIIIIVIIIIIIKIIIIRLRADGRQAFGTASPENFGQWRREGG